MRVAKAHGLGNDFLLVEEADCPAAADGWARRLCDRHTGVGADGVLVYGVSGGSARMRLINADGSEAEISGNGLRCLAAWLSWKGRVPPAHVVETGAGARPVEVQPIGGTRFRVRTDLGPAILDSRAIPVALDPPSERVIDHRLEAGEGTVAITATSLGNPHCAVFLDRPATDGELAVLGPVLERHPFFPRRTNVEFVSVLGPDRLRVRFWERGVGPTLASGTGSCAAALAAMLHNRVDNPVTVETELGSLRVERARDGDILLTGPAELICTGRYRIQHGLGG